MHHTTMLIWKWSQMLFLIVDSRSLLSVTWEEFTIFTKDQHLRFILLKKTLDSNASYYNAYLEMVAKHDQKVAAEKEGKKKSASTKQSKPKPAIEKSSKPAPAPKPKESLKFPADEHVLLEDPLNLMRTLPSMKNLEDAYAIEDQFINDKSTDDEPGKLNVEA
ncbi:hypothetical protein Tco_0063176 [Tanacetum coccineum]